MIIKLLGFEKLAGLIGYCNVLIRLIKLHWSACKFQGQDFKDFEHRIMRKNVFGNKSLSRFDQVFQSQKQFWFGRNNGILSWM